LLPWCCYWLGLAFGWPAAGALLAMAILVLVRGPHWRETKAFELAIGSWFVVTAVDRGPLPLAILDGWRPALLPLMLAATAFASLAVDRPCTLQYARLWLDRRWWGNSHVLRVNRLLTAMWGGAFLAMAGLAFALATHLGGRVITGIASAGLFAIAGWTTLQLPYWYRMHCFLPRVRAGLDPYHPAPRRPRWMKYRCRWRLG
jgi:hypothetical protein